jgi:hypothetical protein
MQIKKKINKLNKLYIIFFSTVLFINSFLTLSLNANMFKITNLEISEPFELNFDKEKVINKAFGFAFNELVGMTTVSSDKEKILNTPIATIKRLIDSFEMSEEEFIDNRYYVKFDVNFNKKNTLTFFEKKNIFPSIPIKKKLLLIPIIVDLEFDEVLIYSKNQFYNQWNQNNKRYFLLDYLLLNEDLEDVKIILNNSKSIEEYNFKEIIKKYDLNDFIIMIIYKNNNQLRILSKIQLNNSLKVNNQTFNNIDINNQEDFNLILSKLKITYENYWKKINQINTSIKTPLTISIESSRYKKVKEIENSLYDLDLVLNFNILKFDNNNLFFKIIYNGSPKKFIQEMEKKNIKIISDNQVWKIQ